jgi:formyl-CoA transferase
VVPFAEGPGLTVSSPFTMDGAPKVGPFLAPEIGAHTLAVLRETGYDEAGIQALRERGIVGG